MGVAHSGWFQWWLSQWGEGAVDRSIGDSREK